MDCLDSHLILFADPSALVPSLAISYYQFRFYLNHQT